MPIPGTAVHTSAPYNMSLKPTAVIAEETDPKKRSGINASGMRNLQQIALTLTSALLLLRTENLIHADIKPENCFFRQRNKSLDCSEEIQSSRKHNEQNSNKLLCINDVDMSQIDLHLGDFGNTIHLSEVPLYYPEFEIQSLSYRAPEVLLGLPFGAAIDMWSLGVLLAELCTGSALFVACSREEMVARISRQLCPLCPVRFSGGMFSHLLSTTSRLVSTATVSSSNNGTTTSSSYNSNNNSITRPVAAASFGYALHLKAVKRLLTKALPAESHAVLSAEFLHFLGGLLMPDPKLRLTPQEALAHPFLSDLVSLPYLCLAAGVQGGGEALGSAAGRGGAVAAFSARSRAAAASAAQLRRAVTNPAEPKRVQQCFDRRAAAPVVNNSSNSSNSSVAAAPQFSLPVQEGSRYSIVANESKLLMGESTTADDPPPAAVVQGSITTGTGVVPVAVTGSRKRASLSQHSAPVLALPFSKFSKLI